MDTGYASLRELEDRCRVNIRYMYLMDHETPSYRAFGYFINEEMNGKVEDIFRAVMEYIRKEDDVDLEHLYIDGSKFEANANKYTWVWKKSTEKFRYRLFAKITQLLDQINEDLAYTGLKVETNTEYTPECLEMILDRYAFRCQIDTEAFVHGRGHRNPREQHYYEKLKEYTKKLREYIAVVDVMQYRSDMDCFVPLMEKFKELYGFYPKYPVADAGYGSFNNYIYCQEHGMEKYMKFPMYKKETKDNGYHNDPFRAVNFNVDADGDLVCPGGKKFHFAYRKAVRGNQYGRQEEYYTCEDCSGCPYASQCKKTDKNRTVCINSELSSMHKEVLENLESIQGALLRMNRSIQAEGTFGVMKYDRWYKRVVRKGLKRVKLELILVSIGHNLYKFRNKKMRLPEAA